MEKISERTDGSRHITGYADPVKKYIRVTVVEDKGITDFSIEGLTKEILWLIPSPANNLNWKSGSSIINVDGHTALATKFEQVSQESGLRDNLVPDWYITAISYPEKDTIETILTNGDAYSNNVTWDIHNKMVNEFKL